MVKIKQDIPKLMMEKFSDAVWGYQHLKGIGIFKQLTRDELTSLYQRGQIIALKPQSHAVIEGEQTRGLYVILDGSLSVHKTNPAQGTMHLIAYLDQNSSFGEMSLLDRAPRSATVIAENYCYLFYLDAVVFEGFLNESSDNLKYRFYKTCAEDLSERFRVINADYITAQQLLWKYALRKDEDATTEQKEPAVKQAEKSPTSPTP